MIQPILKDEHGTMRFQENAIVRLLLDESTARGFGLNQLAVLANRFSQADWEQFYQLIGYSLCGYHELSLVSDESALAATQEARKIMPETGGCRDNGCEIHCGVETEEP